MSDVVKMTVMKTPKTRQRLVAALFALIALPVLIGGWDLIRLGGSYYYLLFGAVLATTAFLLWRSKREALTLYQLALMLTLVWALWEVGLDGWALLPRLVAPAVVGLMLVPPTIRSGFSSKLSPIPWPAMVIALAGALLAGVVLHNHAGPALGADPILQAGVDTGKTGLPASEEFRPEDADWRAYGKDGAGTRYSSLTQINPANVSDLEVAWQFEVGPTKTLEATPLKIGETLFLCTSANDVIALEAETGKQTWRYSPEVNTSVVPLQACRGVSYKRVNEGAGSCAERIFTNTVDARLIALDARTGALCREFGQGGVVSLLMGMGPVPAGYYYQTSAPTIAQDKIVVGGLVLDNQYWGEPSGVIRAFDVRSGKLSWAWDMGRPDQNGLPPEGEHYTPSTPNAWSPMSHDDGLGLVYVPLGNPTPDFFGGQRRLFDEKYSSALVALDIRTGKPRWSFQTIRHDIWDYDIPAQPTLFDYTESGHTIRALVQPTKRGELFVLDRETGKPLRTVTEHEVPVRGAVPEERVSPTQPFSTGMPSFRGRDITEADMWGITPLDQLWCRLKFRQARYEGTLTPPGLTPSIEYPNEAGGMQWGGVSVDPARGIAVVNVSHIASYIQLVTRNEVERLGIQRIGREGKRTNVERSPGFPQENTSYGVLKQPFLSPLGIPCTKPPFGTIAAINLKSGKLLWQRPFGTARDAGPMGVPSMLPITLGTPNVGGSVITGSGLFFIGAAQDRYLRGYELTSGTELWRARLPAGGNATPMTYLSSKSGRQFIVIAAGGHPSFGSKSGNAVIAFALPQHR